MALNITVNRAGQADLRDIRILTGSQTSTPSDGGTVTFVVDSLPSGASYTLVDSQSGANDDTAAVTIVPTMGTAGTSTTNGTVHTLTWSRSTETGRTRNVSVVVTNSRASVDTLSEVFSQQAATPVNVGFSTSNTAPFIGDTVSLEGTITGSNGPFDVRIFSGISELPADPATSTTNRVYSEDNTSDLTHTISRTALGNNGAIFENLYAIWVRDNGGETASAFISFSATQPYGYVNHNQTDEVIPWYGETSRLRVVVPGVSSGLSATVSGAGTTVSTPTYLSRANDEGTETWDMNVTWAQGNPGGGRNATVTLSYQGANVLGSFIVSQASSSTSTVTALNITDSVGDTRRRPWNDTTSREVGVSISNFPDGVTSMQVPSGNLTNNILQTLSFNVSASPTDGVEDVSRTGVDDSQLAGANIAVGRTVILRNGQGHYAPVTVGAITPTFITFNGVPSAFSDVDNTDNRFVTNFTTTADTSSTTPAAVTGVTLGTNRALTYDSNAPAGYKGTFAFGSVNSSPDAPKLATGNGNDIIFRGVTIGEIDIRQLARPRVQQELLVNSGTLTSPTLTIDTDNTLGPPNHTIAAASGTDFSVYCLHDVADTFTSITDGVGSDFITLTPRNLNARKDGSMTNNTITPSSLSGVFSGATVPSETSGTNLNTATYARYTRIDLTTSNANATTAVESDTICINID